MSLIAAILIEILTQWLTTTRVVVRNIQSTFGNVCPVCIEDTKSIFTVFYIYLKFSDQLSGDDPFPVNHIQPSTNNYDYAYKAQSVREIVENQKPEQGRHR